MPTLRERAEALPSYAAFVGDGASVPWEYFPPPYRYYLRAYKKYLDSRWPAAFKLHDFLYSGPSAELGHSRAEADLVLYEEIAQDSVVDAAVVYGAVRVFGGRYFRPQQATAASTPDMGIVAQGVSMPIWKATIIMQAVTNWRGAAEPAVTRVAGWSETHYFSASQVSDVQVALIGPINPKFRYPVLVARARILPIGAAVMGYRISRVDPPGPGVAFTYNQKGGPWHSDAPFTALLVASDPLPNGRIIRRAIRCVPDQWVTDGEFAPDPTYRQALNDYLFSLSLWTSYYSAAGGAAKTKVIAVSEAGVAETATAPTWVIGDRLTVKGTKDVGNNSRTSDHIVTAVDTAARRVTLAGWRWGPTRGGEIFRPSPQTISLQGIDWRVSRIVSRKVGRPFVQYRGRRSRRKLPL